MSGVGFAARTPLRLTLKLDAIERGRDVHSGVIVAKKQAVACGANIRTIAIKIDRLIASAVTPDPFSSGPLGYTPRWIGLGASITTREWRASGE